MKISNGKQNKLRCIIVEHEYKDIKTYYKDFDDVLEKYENREVEIVKVYNITESLAEDIMKIGMLVTKQMENEIDFLYSLIKKLTDIEMDIDIKNKNDKLEFQKIIEEPSSLLQTVLNEMIVVLNGYYERKDVELKIRVKQQNMHTSDFNLDAIKQLNELEKKLKKEDIKNA